MNANDSQGRLPESIDTEIDALTKMFPKGRQQSALIGALHAAQAHNGGYLTANLIRLVAERLQLPVIRAMEVATFYSMLETEPVGRNTISVCTNVCCMLRGGDEILEHIESLLNIKAGQSTPDNKFYLKKEEECLAACTGAPMMMLNHVYHENLTIDAVDKLLAGVE